MAECGCGRVILLGSGTHNRWYERHCSRYCYIYSQNPEKYPKVRVSESKHHKNHWMRPHIPAMCDTCGENFDLIDHEKEGNKQFCNRECFRKVLTTKHGHRDWTLLKLLQLGGPLTAAELAHRFVSNLTSPTPRQIGGILKLYVARGMVKCNDEEIVRGANRTYQLNTDLPLGKVVAEKIRLPKVTKT